MQLGGAACRLGLIVSLVATGADLAAAEVVDAELQLGGRTISGDTHSSKFEEYRDLRPGLFGRGTFLLEDPDGELFLWSDLENVGYDDQRYAFEFGEWGRLRLFGDYGELPHVLSNSARTLYRPSGTNLLLLPDALQGALEAAPDNATRSALLGTALAGARDISLDYRVRTGQLGLIFDPTEEWEFETAYRAVARDGHRPFSMGFGSPGGSFANFARPVDERTDEVTADARFARGPWNLELGYLGSFFGNDLNQVTVDNFLRLTDAPNASSQGRISVAPDNSLNSFHATGAYELPFEFPARIATTLAYGLRRQDDSFLPHTINSTLAGAPELVLPRDDLDGKVQTYLANVVMTARPLPELDLRARYRYYDFENDSRVIEFPGHTVNDQGLSTDPRRNVPNDYERQLATFDASYRVMPELKLRGGPFWEQWSRSRDREVSRLDEWGGKLASDYRPASWAIVRLDYLLGIRKGTSYNPYDYLEATLDPDEVADAISTGQLAGLRKYDEADRTRNEIKLLTQVIPRDDLDLTFSAGWTHHDYPHSDYGVTDDKRWNAGTEIGYQPLEWLSLSAWYSFEHLELKQNSRWRPRTFAPPVAVTDDPVNDWSSESTDLIHTLGARIDVVIVPEKLDLSFGYTFERGNGQTHSRASPGCVPAPVTGVCLPAGTAADGGNAPNYPDIEDRLQIFTTILRYHVSENLSFEGMYAFEKLSLSDYRVDGLNPFMPNSNVNGSGVVSPSLDVFLGDRLGDYQAHIFALSATYRF